MTFALDLQRFAEKAKDKADEAIGGIVFNIARELDKRSPVGDATYWQSPAPKGYVGGRFRGNWQLGVNVRMAGELNRIDPDGRQTLGAIAAAIPDEAAGNVFYLSNNVPYALRLEYGHSRQAPAGVVGLTAALFQQIVRDEVGAVQ